MVLYGLYLADGTMKHGEANADKADAREAAAHAGAAGAAARSGGGKSLNDESAAPLLDASERGGR